MSDETTLEMEAAEVLRRLIIHGYQAFFVGGYVRDHLLRQHINDIDIATSALPEQVMDCFPRTVPTGLQHGTVTVIMSHHVFEVTTFRKETEYENNRRPKQVEFIPDLIKDLERRDFTINAMAMDAEGKLIDPYGGFKDLQNGVLRCVGDPEMRFNEDALRMLRCIRFAAAYELEIDHHTWTALLLQRTRLQAIAMERVRVELERMIEGPHPVRGLKLLESSGLLHFLKVDIGISLPLGQAKVVRKLEYLVHLADPELRWSYLFLCSGILAIQAKTAMNRLTFSGKKLASIIQVLAFHEWFAEKRSHDNQTLESWKEDWIQGALSFGKPALEGWLAIMHFYADRDGQAYMQDAGKQQNHWILSFVSLGLEWLKAMPASSMKELAVTGSDLIAAGVNSGPEIGELLNRLLWKAATSTVPNEKSALLKSAGLG